MSGAISHFLNWLMIGSPQRIANTSCRVVVLVTGKQNWRQKKCLEKNERRILGIFAPKSMTCECLPWSCSLVPQLFLLASWNDPLLHVKRIEPKSRLRSCPLYSNYNQSQRLCIWILEPHSKVHVSIDKASCFLPSKFRGNNRSTLTLQSLQDN